jgi:hypothetical protein
MKDISFSLAGWEHARMCISKKVNGRDGQKVYPLEQVKLSRILISSCSAVEGS